MSMDREKWLAMRETKKRRTATLVHNNGTFVRAVGDKAKDAKRSAFQQQCIRNFTRKRQPPVTYNSAEFPLP